MQLTNDEITRVSLDERLTLIAQLWEPGRRSSASDSGI
jgi:hypothetical protein